MPRTIVFFSSFLGLEGSRELAWKSLITRATRGTYVTCECGNETSFKDCCGRFLSGSENPQTAEELMRSRFVAFGLGNFDYIENTQLDALPAEVRQRQAPEWERLEIISCQDGGAEDETGTVEFVAYYNLKERRVHRELSRFVRVDTLWRYKDGDITDEPAPESAEPKVGRNESCPCGSGKKYKRCCGV